MMIYDNFYMKWNKGNDEYVLHIQQDEYAENPRTFCDHDTVFAAFGSHSQVGDRINEKDPEEFWNSLVQKYAPTDKFLTVEQCQNRLYLYLVSLPVWGYSHSGLTISCGERVYPYNDQWDSGLLGWIVFPKPDYWGADWRKRAFEVMRAEVEEVDMWLRGEVYGYTLYKNGEEIDSCWGFYGSNLEESGIAEYIPELSEILKSDNYTSGAAQKKITTHYVFD